MIQIDMEMPKSCADCFKKTECFFAQCNGWIGDKRDDDCPLKEVKVVDKCFDCRVNLLAKTKTNSVLEDIKAEIEELKLDCDLDIGEEDIYNNAINDVLEIIDKHINGEDNI